MAKKRSGGTGRTPAGKPDRAPMPGIVPRGEGLLAGGGFARAAAPALLAAATWLVFWRALGADFVNWDDNWYVLENPAVWGLAPENLRAIFSQAHFANYIPITLFSYALDYSLWGGANPLGYHLTNVVLHTVNVLLAFAWLRALGLRLGVSLVAALIFAIHPVQVESVAWVSERKNLLFVLFLLLCLLVIERRDRAAPAVRGRWTALALLAFAASLLSKPAAVVLPVVLALRLYALRGERRWRAYLHLVPFFLLALAAAGVTVLAQRDWGGLREVAHVPYGAVLVTMFAGVLRYAKLVLFPVSLSIVYYFKEPAGLLDPAILPAAMLGGIILALWVLVTLRMLRCRPALGFWFAWPLVILLPVSNLVPLGTYAADRYLYLAVLGLGVVAARGLSALVGRGGDRRGPVFGGAALGVACLALAASARVGDWHDSLSLWQSAVAASPRAGKARVGLANTLAQTGRTAEAIAAYRKLLAVNPQPVTYLSLGFNLIQVGQVEEGLAALRRGVDLGPVPERALPGERAYYGEAFLQLGSYRLQAGDAPGALADLERARRYGKARFETEQNLGLAYQLLGRHGAAREAFTRAIARAPDSFQAHQGLGLALWGLGEREAALAELRRAQGLARGPDAANVAGIIRSLEAQP